MYRPWRGHRSPHYDFNWVRYYNHALWLEHQKHAAFQYMNHVYNRTYEPILPSSQNLVGYRNDNAGKMGIDTTKDKDLPLPGNIQSFKCLVCGALFTNSSVMERHRKRHPHMESDRKHRCHLCSYSSDNAYHFKRHLLTHSGEKKHQCTHCPKAFADRRTLVVHIRTHTGERPFSCSMCGKSFGTSTNLRSHERVHTQEKSYRCQHCDYTSVQASSLRSHIRYKHTRDFKHKCSYCKKGFIGPSELKRHIERVHSTSEISNKLSSSEPVVE